MTRKFYRTRIESPRNKLKRKLGKQNKYKYYKEMAHPDVRQATSG